jgi:hypothetical protein
MTFRGLLHVRTARRLDAVSFDEEQEQSSKGSRDSVDKQ